MSNIKWTEQDYIDTLTRAKQWFIDNKNAIYFKEYFIDFNRVDAVKDIPWNSLRQYYTQYKSATDLWDEIVTMQEMRIIKWIISGHIKSPAFGQFLLKTKHNYIETTRQQVEVTNKDIQFKFDNADLTDSQLTDEPENNV